MKRGERKNEKGRQKRRGNGGWRSREKQAKMVTNLPFCHWHWYIQPHDLAIFPLAHFPTSVPGNKFLTCTLGGDRQKTYRWHKLPVCPGLHLLWFHLVTALHFTIVLVLEIFYLKNSSLLSLLLHKCIIKRQNGFLKHPLTKIFMRYTWFRNKVLK